MSPGFLYFLTATALLSITCFFFVKFQRERKAINTNEAIRETLDEISEQLYGMTLETQSVRILKRQRKIRYMIHQLVDMKFKEYGHPLLMHNLTHEKKTA